jgi:hypothetical protein
MTLAEKLLTILLLWLVMGILVAPLAVWFVRSNRRRFEAELRRQRHPLDWEPLQ